MAVDARWIGRLETTLSVMFALAVLGAAGLLLVTVVSVFFRPGYGMELVLPVTETAGVLRPGARLLAPTASAAVTTTHASLPLAGLYLLTWLPGEATALFTIGGLIRVLRRGRGGDRALFSAETVTALRRIAVVLIGGSVLAAVLSVLAKAGATRMLLHDFALTWPGLTPGVGVLAGLGLLAVSEIVRRGLVMLADLEGTV